MSRLNSMATATATATATSAASTRTTSSAMAPSSPSSSSHSHTATSRWHRSHSHSNRPSTASTVQSFTSASPDMADGASASSVASSASDHTESGRQRRRQRRRSSSSVGRAASRSSRRDATPQQPDKIGKSFESLLASDETWVLRETARVADAHTAPSSRPDDLSSPVPGTPNVISRQPRYLQDSSPVLLTPTLSTDDLATTPTTETGPFMAARAGAASASTSATPAPESPLRAPPAALPTYPKSPADDGMSSYVSASSGAGGGPSVSVDSATISVASSKKGRFKRTGEFLKRFTGGGGGSSSGGGGGSSGIGSTPTSSLMPPPPPPPAASYNRHTAASTVSLHHPSPRGRIPTGGSVGGSSSVDVNPTATAAQTSSASSTMPRRGGGGGGGSGSISATSARPLPPDVPAKSSRPTKAPTAKSAQRTSSMPVHEQRVSPATTTKATKTLPTPPPPPSSSSAAIPASTSASSSASAPSSSSSSSSSPSLGTSESGRELRTKMRAWETEMDDAFKERAQDLDAKTRFTNRATWGPSPRLPELALGGGDGGAEGGGGDVNSSSHNDRKSNSSNNSSRNNKTINTAAGLGVDVDGESTATTPRTATMPRPARALNSSTTSSSLAVDESQRRRGGGVGGGGSLSETASAPATPTQADFSRRSRSDDGGAGVPAATTAAAASAATKTSQGLLPPRGTAAATRPSSSVDTRPEARSSTSTSTSTATAAAPRSRSYDEGPATATTTATATAATPLASPSRGKATHDSAVSTTTAASFDTAVDGGGSGSGSGDGHENEIDADKAAATDAHLRPENSIRLISPSPSASQNLEGLAITVPRGSALSSISEGRGVTRNPTTPTMPLTAPPRPQRSRQVSANSAVSTTAVAGATPLSNASPLGTSVSVMSQFGGGGGRSTPDVNVDVDVDEDADATTTSEARTLADKCWNEDETFLKRERIAEWLGGLGAINAAARTHYFAHFDFVGLRVDAALRRLCDKLFLKAETQQVDRVLAAFSRRFYACNPLPIYGDAQSGPDVVHAVVFSLLLLNTDLHVADISERMTRAQFVRNTMAAVVPGQESGGDGVAAAAPTPAPTSTLASRRSSVISSATGVHSMRRAAAPAGRPSLSSRAGGDESFTSSHDATSPSPALESMLKEMYNAVKADRIRLPNVHGGGGSDDLPTSAGGTGTLMMRRQARLNNNNNLGPPSASSNTASNRVSQLKRGSIRGLQGLLGAARSEESISPGSQSQSSSVGSRGDGGGWLANLQQASQASSASSPWTSMTSVGSPVKSSSSSSAESFAGGGAGAGGAVVQPASLGFASTLAQNIIKEAAHESDDGGGGRGGGGTIRAGRATAAAAASSAGHTRVRSLDSTAEDVDDDELALIGAPWAKEGVLSRKHYWESPQRRAKDKNWVEVFVVVERGTLSMFRFGSGGAAPSSTTPSSSTVKASPLAGASNAVFGGGNWLSSASRLGDFPLAHTLANALPPPGYNRARPHVFALTLPSGAVYFLQAGTEDLVAEWVSTCNYWAARTSRQPLAGGVSNMEYGWNKVLPRVDDDDDDGDDGEGAWRGSVDADEVREEMSSMNSSSRGGSVKSPRGGRRLALPTTGSSSNTTATTAATTPDESIYSGVVGGARDTRSIRSGRSGRSFGSRAYQSWQDGAAGHGNHAGSRASSMITSGGSSSISRNPFASSRAHAHGNERMYINEWKAPAAPTVHSTLGEEAQMEACVAYIARTESELTEHNELRTPMLALYSPRGSNYSKALANWERKSNYLLAELVKWQGYVESLTQAMRLRGERRDMKQMELALARADEEMAKVGAHDVGGAGSGSGGAGAGADGPVLV